MLTLTVVSAKGGCGASLVATNLALALESVAPCLLLDADTRGGSADMLLDLDPGRSWDDLLPVLSELTGHHLDLAACRHESGLRLLASPETVLDSSANDRLPVLIQALGRLVVWIVVDAPTRSSPNGPTCTAADMILLVMTPDPPALRSARCWLDDAPEGLRRRVGLVINQHQTNGPIQPEEIARSLGVSLLASLPTDRHAVGQQIHYGRPCVLQDVSPFAGGIRLLAQRIAAIRTVREDASLPNVALSS